MLSAINVGKKFNTNYILKNGKHTNIVVLNRFLQFPTGYDPIKL